MIRAEAIHIPFKYAAGEAGSAFFSGLRDEQVVRGARCAQCARVYVPLRTFCAQCGHDELSPVEVGPGGTLAAWTDMPGRGVFALVLLDGADAPMLHRLLPGAAPIAAGMRVRARFAVERTGSILDLEGFAPEDEAA